MSPGVTHCHPSWPGVTPLSPCPIRGSSDVTQCHSTMSRCHPDVTLCHPSCHPVLFQGHLMSPGVTPPIPVPPCPFLVSPDVTRCPLSWPGVTPLSPCPVPGSPDVTQCHPTVSCCHPDVTHCHSSCHPVLSWCHLMSPCVTPPVLVSP